MGEFSALALPEALLQLSDCSRIGSAGRILPSPQLLARTPDQSLVVRDSALSATSISGFDGRRWAPTVRGVPVSSMKNLYRCDSVHVIIVRWRKVAGTLQSRSGGVAEV
jgi:hypothetical protein